MHNLTFLSIDTETSGLSLENDRILQYGVAMFVHGKCVEVNTFDVRQEVTNNAFVVNGITDERIRNGYNPYDIAMLLNMVLSKPPRRIVCYNAPFDLNFIGAEFQRLEFGYDFSRITVVDPLVIFRRFNPFKKARLSDACAKYNVSNPAAHDAGSDAVAAGEIYVNMYSQYGTLRNNYSNKMLEGWHRNWASSFKEYLVRKEVEFDEQDFEWPCRKEYLCWESQPVSLQLDLDLS